jgi:asparagine synthase (glutamine-hydrolysing)
MCGIAGVVKWREPADVSTPILTRMSDRIRHRGPDDAGLWISPDRRIGLAFRRLAIVDLSPTANQPMSNEDDTVRVVFNGEIYNHAEIRRELKAIGGHRWRTDHSDTEVIVHAFEQWGIGFLERLRGMFAIGLWDARRRELWLIRDRIGIKPLYYTVQPDRITFASEIKALLEDSALPRAVDEEALFHYLSFLVTPAPDTLFAGIKKLPAGSWLRVGEDGQTHCERYWDPWGNVQPRPDISEGAATDELMARLREAVQLRKVSDVPVGVFLSGGIDSSTNTVLFSEGEANPVRTFSVGYDREYASYTNELRFARQIAAKVGAQHHEVIIRQQDALEFVPRMVELQDEPIADPVCIPVYFVSKLARDHGVIVCQVGEGADELFCGYPFWDEVLRKQQLAGRPAMSPANAAVMAGLRLAGHDRSLLFEQLRRAQRGQPIFWSGAEAFSQRGKERLLSDRLRQRFRDRTSWDYVETVHRRFTTQAWEASPLHWMSYVDLSLRLPELLLMRVDKMSMGASIECRVPFLDHKFVEFVLGLPQSLVYRPGHPKSLLKRAVAGLLPPEIIHRPKQGFGVPITEWFVDLLGDTVRDTLRRFVRQTDYFSPAEVEELIRRRRTNQMWYLYNFALWWKRYIENQPPTTA